jgi:DHA2 family multidrug resistance protein
VPGPLARRAITVTVVLATLIQALDATIANVALPRIQGSLGGTQESLAWVLTSYIVASAICMPLTGFLAARWGRRRVFVASVIGFTLASVACGLATSLAQLVAFRTLQGAFGAFLVPLSQSVLLDTWPRERHRAAMAAWGVGVMLGPILGPTVGGWLSEHHHWRWVFFINLPIGALTLAGLLAFLPANPGDRARRFDVAGFAFLAVGIASLQLMLDRGGSLDWFESREIVAWAVLAALGGYLYLVHALTHASPLLPRALFADRNFCAGLATMFAVGAVLLATMALLPPLLHGLGGHPIDAVGVLLAPRGVGTMAAMLVVGRWGHRVDGRATIAAGLALAAVSLAWMARFEGDTPTRDVVASGLLQGFGLGLVFPSLNALSFASVAPRHRDDGASLFAMVRNLGSSIGISLVIAALSRYSQAYHAALSAHVDPSGLALRLAIESGAWRIDTPEGLAAIQAEVARQAATLAFQQDFRLTAWFCAATIPLVLLFRAVPRAAPPAAAPG